MKGENILFKEIMNEKNLSENIPVFFKNCAGINYMHAGMEFAVNYFNLCEALHDGELKLSVDIKLMLDELNQYISSYFTGVIEKGMNEEVIKELIEKLNSLRNRIIDRMQMLTMYSDRFLLYEYILKRMSLSYEDIVEDINQDEAFKMVVNYIFYEKDNVIINEKIRSVLYNLPVRMTKNKFADLIKNAVYAYIGHERSSLDDFLYMIRTVAGIQELKQTDEAYEQKLLLLKGADYRTLQKEEHIKLSDELRDITEQLYNETDSGYSLQEIVNSLYAVMLNRSYAGDDELGFVDGLLGAVNNNLGLIRMYQGFVKTDEGSACGELIETGLEALKDSEIFEIIEGKLDEYSEKLQNSQMVFSKIKEDTGAAYEEYKKQDIYKILDISEKLLGGSLFIDFRNERRNEAVDKKCAEEELIKLNDAFNMKLSVQDRSLNRAMIASVLRELPVFFSDMQAVADYVKTAFGSCHDIAERRASYQLILEEIEEMGED